MQIDTEEVAGSNSAIPAVNKIESTNCKRDRLIPMTIRVLKGAEVLSAQKRVDGQLLCAPPFFCDSLLVDVHRDPAVGMPKQYLGCLDLHPVLPKQGH